MFKFFTQKEWRLWSWVGSFIILSSLWVQVQIDVKINEWFGQFYDMIQKALAAPNSITIGEYWASLLSFITLAGIYVALATVVAFFTSHYLFRWRTAMIDWYHSVYDKARTIEGASQRVQEDTIKFSRIMEGLGTSFIEAIMMLVEFTPILFGLSIGIPILFFGDWNYGLVTGAFIWTVGGTLFLIVLGSILRLVGVEYDLQKNEASYRKLLVIAEDDITIRPKNLDELFNDVHLGLMSQEPTIYIIGTLMKRKNCSVKITFKELFNKYNKKITITGVCLNDCKLHYFNNELTPDMKILDALRITMSIPILFKPVKYKNQIFVDGALGNNYPIDYFKEEDLEKIIGINITNSYEYNNIFNDQIEYFLQIFKCMIKNMMKINNELYDKYTINIKYQNILEDYLDDDLSKRNYYFLFLEKYYGFKICNCTYFDCECRQAYFYCNNPF